MIRVGEDLRNRKLMKKNIFIYRIRNNVYANVRNRYIQNTIYCISKYLKNSYAIEKIVDNATKFSIVLDEWYAFVSMNG